MADLIIHYSLFQRGDVAESVGIAPSLRPQAWHAAGVHISAIVSR